MKDLTEHQQQLKDILKKEAERINQAACHVNEYYQNLLKIKAEIQQSEQHGLAAIDKELADIMKSCDKRKENLKAECRKALSPLNAEINKVRLLVFILM